MPTNEQQAFDWLKAIDTEWPTPESIVAYLSILHQEMQANGESPIDPDFFFTETALLDWYDAWTDRANTQPLPIHIDNLPIRLLLHQALTPFYCHSTNKDIVTMAERVERAKKIMASWLSANQVPEGNEAAKKANREAQHRFRLRQRAKRGDADERAQHALAVGDAYAAYIEACRKRKEAIAQWDSYVEAARKLWKGMKEQSPIDSQ